jgi:hypothetical protein
VKLSALLGSLDVSSTAFIIVIFVPTERLPIDGFDTLETCRIAGVARPDVAGEPRVRTHRARQQAVALGGDDPLGRQASLDPLLQRGQKVRVDNVRARTAAAVEHSWGQEVPDVLLHRAQLGVGPFIVTLAQLPADRVDDRFIILCRRYR